MAGVKEVSMKMLIATLLAAAGIQAAATEEVTTLATAYQNGMEIELYASRAACPQGFLRGAKFPEGVRDQYTMGCWKTSDNIVTIQFSDGTTTTLTRRQLIPKARSGQTL
jgi:hypothetical protein